MGLCEAWCRITYEMLKGTPVLQKPLKRDARGIVWRAVPVFATQGRRPPKHAGNIGVRKRTSGDKLIEKRR